MHSQQAMPYKTDQLEMTNVIFQSMVNNIGNRIRKMNFQLHFKTQTDKAEFIKVMQRQKERELNQIELIESDRQEQSEHLSGSYIKSATNLDLDCIVIEETFEKSILLREKFMDKFRQIGKRLNVTFMVVPNKVKISGIIRDRVDQAQDQYRQIQEDICFQPIDKYGREVYQSKFFKAYLKEHRVQIIQILRKYYFWFMKTQAEPKEIIGQVFMKTSHAFYPLCRMKKIQRQAISSGKSQFILGQMTFARPGQKITDKLYINLRSRIFEQAISKKLNQMQDRKQRQVELSEDRQGLIMHMDADQQIQIQRSSIEQQYSKYKYLNLIFNERVEMHKVTYIFTNLQFHISVIWQIINNYVCLGFIPALISEPNVINPLVQIINELPKQLLDFRLGFYDTFQLPQDSQWTFLTVERDHSQKITLVGVKSRMKKSYQKMIALYIENKLSSQYLNKAKQQKLNTTNSSKLGQVSMDMTKAINESTQFFINQLDNSVRQPENSISMNFNKNILTGEITSIINFRFDNYHICINQTQQDKQKKYVEEITKVQRTKLPTKNQELQKIMYNATTFKYKFWRLKIPKSFNYDMQKQVDLILNQKPELKQFNRWITVFSKQTENFYQPTLKVKITKIEKNYKIKEGFLINTNALFIYLEETQELPYGRYELINFIRKME